MQTQKDGIKRRILESAKREFEEKGFMEASIRSIAQRANVSKSNIYNYFAEKDALFSAVVETTVSGLEKGLAQLKARYANPATGHYTKDAQEEMMALFMRFASKHGRDLKIILFKSSGSNLADFKRTITEELAAVLELWLRRAAPSDRFPEFFLLSIAGFYIDTLEKILANEFSPAEICFFSGAFLDFVHGGWSSVLSRSRNREPRIGLWS